MSTLRLTLCWTSSYRAVVLMATAATLLSACTDSVAPPPTGQIGGGNGGPVPFGNDIPIASSGPPVVSSAGGTSPRPPISHDVPAASNAVAALPDAKGVGKEFYATAAEVGSNGPAGLPVRPDDRGEQAVAKAAAQHPALVSFDASAATVLPVPDPGTAYEPIIDPAEGAIDEKDQIELKTPASEIDRVLFSAPNAGQVIIASRLSSSGEPDRTCLDRYNLVAGKHESRLELSDQAALLDISPDGTRALVRFTFGLPPELKPSSSNTRLDVLELSEVQGRHIVGWSPGGGTGSGSSVPVDAAFLDGDRILTLSDSGRLTLWNLAEQKAVYTIETGSSGPLVMTPGRKYCVIFTGTTFGAFDAASGAFRGLMAPPRPTLAACRSAAFSPDGKQIAALLRRPAQSLLCWNVDVGRPAYEIDAPLGLGAGLHFGSPGFVVVGGVLFDVERKQPTWLYVENGNSLNIGVSPDRRHWLVTKPAFRETSLIATESPSDAVLAASASPTKLSAPLLGPGDRLAVRLDVGGFAGDKEAFETALARALGQVLDGRGLRLDGDADLTMDLKLDQHRTGESISFNSTGIGGGEAVPAHEIDFTISIAGRDGKSLWSTTGRVPPSYFLAKEEGKTLETVLLENLWQAAPRALASEIDESMPAYVRTPSTENTLGQTRLWAGPDDISRPGGQAAIAASDDANDSDANAIDDAPVRQPTASVPVSSPVRDLLVVSAPYGWLATAGEDGAVRIWDPRTFRRLDEVRPGRSAATRLAAHAGGNAFVFGSEDGQVRTYDLARRKAGGGYDGANGAVTALAVTSEQAVIAGTQGGRVFRWFEDARTAPTVVADGQAAVSGLATVPYTNRAVMTWTDGIAKLVDVGTGETVYNYDVQAGPIHDVAVSPDGQSAVLATETGGAIVVSLMGGKEIGRVGAGSITAVAFRPDGVKFATGSKLGQVVLWRAEERTPESRLEGAGGHITGLVFSTSGQAVAAGVAGRRVVPVWDLTSSAEGGRTGPSSSEETTPMRMPRRPFGPSGSHDP